jgi:hypothetical protein
MKRAGLGLFGISPAKSAWVELYLQLSGMPQHGGSYRLFYAAAQSATAQNLQKR